MSTAGINLTVKLRVTAGDDVLEASKWINISQVEDRNVNPEPPLLHLIESDLVTDDSIFPTEGPSSPQKRCLLDAQDDPSRLAPGTYKLSPLNIPEAPATYDVLTVALDPESPFTLVSTEESYFFSFFSTEGTFSDDITSGDKSDSSVTWTLPSEASTSSSLWVVVRDGRGGVSWCHSEILLDADAP